MGVESGSPLERVKETRGYKLWKNRDPINRLTSLRIDLARWMEKPLVPQPRTVEHVTADRVTRREFFKGMAGLAVAGGLYLLGRQLKRARLLEKIFSPEYKTDLKGDVGEFLGGPAEQKEIFQLYILDGSEGAKTFCKDIAIFSGSVNRDTYEDVVFEDCKTWGRSELYEMVKHYARFMGHLKTEKGRGQIRDGIEEHGGAYQKHYDDNLKKLEKWIEREGLEINISSSDLKRFFIEELGYSEEAWRILADVEKSWHTQDFRGDLRERINNFNEKNNIEFKISEQREIQVVESSEIADARMAGEFFRKSGLEEVIDAETTVAIARESLPPAMEVQELKTMVREVLLLPSYVAKPPVGRIDPMVAFAITVSLLARESPKLTEWARSQWKELKNKFTSSGQ